MGMGMTAAARPSRTLRSLPWLAGLLIGASAHVVWWTSTRDCAPRAVEVVVPAVTVHVHMPSGPPVIRHVHEGSASPSSSPAAASSTVDARGAVVCRVDRCTVRRSFVRRLVGDPGLLGHGTRLVPRYEDGTLTGLKVFGVHPGGIADLLGLVSGDTIVEVDGRGLGWPEAFIGRAGRLLESEHVELTLEHAGRRRTMQYELVDG